MKIKKGDTFFQWRKDRRLAPIILEVLKVVDDREGYRGIYQGLLPVGESESPVGILVFGRFVET